MKICFKRDNPNSTFYFEPAFYNSHEREDGRLIEVIASYKVYTLKRKFLEMIGSDGFNSEYILLEELRDQKIGEILNG
jgi:hypothetical protein